MISSPRTVVFVGVAALGLVVSPDHAEDTIKATPLKNTIQLDANSVKAGTVTFEVNNAPDTGLAHELVMLTTDLAADKLPVADGQVLESQFKKCERWRASTPARTRGSSSSWSTAATYLSATSPVTTRWVCIHLCSLRREQLGSCVL
jgi:hypothetical protein